MASTVAVSEATSDLVNSYEQTLNYVPILAEKLEEMQKQTTRKAQVLNEKMKQLIEGYEHLDTVSSTVSHGFRKAAADYKERVLDVALNGGIHSIGMPPDNLDRLKAELDSIAHERVVVDVLTRDMLRDHKLAEGNNRKIKTGSGSGSGSGRTHVGSVVRVKSKELMDPIIIPEYTSKVVTAANDLLERNMSDVLLTKRRDPSGVLARNSSLGFVVPSARIGVPAEVLGLKTTPSSAYTPANSKTRTNKKKFGHDVIYGLLSEELSHRNSVLQKELRGVRDQLDELGNKKVQKPKAWSKEALTGLIEATVSKYAGLERKRAPTIAPPTTKQAVQETPFYPTEPPPSQQRERREEVPHPGQPLTYQYPQPVYFPYHPPPPPLQPPTTEEILEYILKSYKVIQARGKFDSIPSKEDEEVSLRVEQDSGTGPEQGVSIDAQTREQYEEEWTSDAMSHGAMLMGVDSDYIMFGGKEGVRWVATSNAGKYTGLGIKEAYGNSSSVDGNTGTSALGGQSDVIVIQGQKLQFEQFDDNVARNVLKYRPQRGAIVSDTPSVPYPSSTLPADSLPEILRSEVDIAIPRIPWTVLSRVRPLRKLGMVDSLPVGNVDIMPAEIPTPELPSQPITEPPTITTNSDTVTPLVGLLQSMVQSHQDTIQNNYELLNKLLTKTSEGKRPEEEEQYTKVYQFFAPLTRIGIDVFTEVYKATHKSAATADGTDRNVSTSLLMSALRGCDEFAVAIAADERFGADESVDSVLDRIETNFSGNRTRAIGLNELVGFLERAHIADDGEVVSTVRKKEPTASGIAVELAKALSDMVATAAGTKNSNGDGADKLSTQFVVDAVRLGISEGVSTVLETLQKNKQVDQSNDDSFMTYDCSMSGDSDDEELAAEVTSYEATRRGLLHVHGLGVNARGGDAVTRDGRESRAVVAALHGDDESAEPDMSMLSAGSSGTDSQKPTSRKLKTGRERYSRSDSSSSSNSSSSSYKVQSKPKIAPPAVLPPQWDRNGRRIRRPFQTPLMSRKAGCQYTLAAQGLDEDSDNSLLSSRGSSSKSSSLSKRAATRYSDFDESRLTETSSVQESADLQQRGRASGRTVIRQQEEVTTLALDKSADIKDEDENDASAETLSIRSADTSNSSVNRKVVFSLQLARKIHRAAIA